MDPFSEDGGIERLAQKAMAIQSDRFHHVVTVIVVGHDQNTEITRRIGNVATADRLQQLQSVARLHIDIGQDQIDITPVSQQLCGRLAVECRVDPLAAQFFQHLAAKFIDDRLVIHDQNGQLGYVFHHHLRTSGKCMFYKDCTLVRRCIST